MRRIDRLISDYGFTLVELIVMLLVIAVIAVIAAPKMSSDPVLVATQAEQLAGDIRYVQTLAMTQAQRYRINLTATGYTFTLADAGGTAVIHPLTGSTARHDRAFKPAPLIRADFALRGRLFRRTDCHPAQGARSRRSHPRSRMPRRRRADQDGIPGVVESSIRPRHGQGDRRQRQHTDRLRGSMDQPR